MASVVTYAEMLTGPHLGHRDASVVRGFFTRLVADLRPVDRHVAERAAELRGATRALRLPDALILATADLHADAVVTADARWESVPDLCCEVRSLSGPR